MRSKGLCQRHCSVGSCFHAPDPKEAKIMRVRAPYCVLVASYSLSNRKIIYPYDYKRFPAPRILGARVGKVLPTIPDRTRKIHNSTVKIPQNRDMQPMPNPCDRFRTMRPTRRFLVPLPRCAKCTAAVRHMAWMRRVEYWLWRNRN
jgi:hypothetical protein